MAVKRKRPTAGQGHGAQGGTREVRDHDAESGRPTQDPFKRTGAPLILGVHLPLRWHAIHDRYEGPCPGGCGARAIMAPGTNPVLSCSGCGMSRPLVPTVTPAERDGHFEAAVRWCRENLLKHRTTNPAAGSSYRLKHTVERQVGYFSAFDFSCVLVAAGFTPLLMPALQTFGGLRWNVSGRSPFFVLSRQRARRRWAT